MHELTAMLKSHPRHADTQRPGLEECIVACNDCVQTCLSCADACVAENQGDPLLACIRLDLDCAAICAATAQILSRSSQPNWTVISAVLRACETACAACGSECDRHAAHMEHCRICAAACHACAAACGTLLGTTAEAK